MIPTIPRAHRRRLWALAAVAAVVVLAVGTWAVVRDDDGPDVGDRETVTAPGPATGLPPTGSGALVRVDLTVTPTIADIPGARTVESGRSRAPITIGRDGVSHGVPTGSDAASYLEISTPAPVTRMGLTARFPPAAPGSTSGFVALVAFDESAVDARAENKPFPYAGIHFVADNSTWDLGVLDPEIGANSLLSGTWTQDPGATAPPSFAVERDGSVLTVVLPDGRRSSVADPRVAAWTGKWATWELYEPRVGVTPAAITALWAS